MTALQFAHENLHHFNKWKDAVENFFSEFLTSEKKLGKNQNIDIKVDIITLGAGSCIPWISNIVHHGIANG